MKHLIKNEKLRRILTAIYYVFIGVLLTLDIFLIIGRVNCSKNGPSFFYGNKIYTVQNHSMEADKSFYDSHPEYEIKAIPVDSAINVSNAPNIIYEGDTPETREKKQAAIDSWYSSLKNGDVLTFVYQSNKNYIVTHRVVSVVHSGDIYTVSLRADVPDKDPVTKEHPIQTVNSDSGLIIGKVSNVNTDLGRFVNNYLLNDVAFGCSILIPAGLIFAYEIVKIVLLLTEGKREKAKQEAEENKNRDLELEELRRKVAELEKQNQDKEA